MVDHHMREQVIPAEGVTQGCNKLSCGPVSVTFCQSPTEPWDGGLMEMSILTHTPYGGYNLLL